MELFERDPVVLVVVQGHEQVLHDLSRDLHWVVSLTHVLWWAIVVQGDVTHLLGHVRLLTDHRCLLDWGEGV